MAQSKKTQAKKVVAKSAVKTVKAQVAKQASPVRSAAEPLLNKKNFAANNFGSANFGVVSSEAFLSLVPGIEDAKKAQATLNEFSREGAEKFAKGADAATRVVGEACELGMEGLDAALGYSNRTSELASAVNEEVTSLATSLADEQFKAVEQFLKCRNAVDLLNLQSNLLTSALDFGFDSAFRVADLVVEYSKDLEPVNQRLGRATQDFVRSCGQE